MLQGLLCYLVLCLSAVCFSSLLLISVRFSLNKLKETPGCHGHVFSELVVFQGLSKIPFFLDELMFCLSFFVCLSHVLNASPYDIDIYWGIIKTDRLKLQIQNTGL